ncbi:hypothetical protein EDC27_1373 [Desulfosoma caldarium]|uniref:Uncharacterized protein n=1 Tax=Desulfosoma caldarium TaxID=610254 RepID=A0A3N1UUG2_9BACT|nr:hypothetical protein EDC27_1373 [Desulfosoma caldarium]
MILSKTCTEGFGGMCSTRGKYCQALEEEMSSELKHPTLGKAQKADRLAKVQALPEEASPKIEGLQQKYEIRLTVSPSGALRLLVGVVQAVVTLQHRQWQRTVALFWNPVTRALNPMVGKSCGASTRDLCSHGRRWPLSMPESLVRSLKMPEVIGRSRDVLWPAFRCQPYRRYGPKEDEP